MAPDADKLRQRGGKTTVVITTTADNSNARGGGEEEVERLCATVAGLKTTEVCIDGVIYDITNFDHPGGDSILIFGGNDVTIQYNMIHPYHTSKHLEKMKRVGKVAEYAGE